MEKTEDLKKVVIVIDEQGNNYESTYPKRAKGLVKSGRARLIGDSKICLVCPPKNILEEKIVNNIENKLDITYIINKIDAIIEQGKVLYSEMSHETKEAIIAREETNRKMIDFLREILDRLNPKVDTFTINSNVITGLTDSLNVAIENDAIEAQKSIINALTDIQKSTIKSTFLVNVPQELSK